MQCIFDSTTKVKILVQHQFVFHKTMLHYLEASGLNDAHVSWDTITKLDVDDVAYAELLSLDVLFLTFTDDDGVLEEEWDL